MKVIEIAGTIAIVDSTDQLVANGVQFIEIDEDDSNCIIKNKAEYGASLRSIFSDVMVMFGIRIGQPAQEQTLNLSDETSATESVNAH